MQTLQNILHQQSIQSSRKTISSMITLHTRKQLGITEARLKLSEVVDGVRYQGDTVLLEKSGKPAAVIIPIEDYLSWREQRAAKFAVIRKIQDSVKEKFTEEEAMALALEAQRAVRKSSA